MHDVYDKNSNNMYTVITKEILDQYEKGSDDYLALRKMKIIHVPVIHQNTVFKNDSQSHLNIDTYVDTLVFVETFNKLIVLNNITSGFHFFEDCISTAIDIGNTLRGGLKKAKIWPEEVVNVYVFTHTKTSNTGLKASLSIYNGIC